MAYYCNAERKGRAMHSLQLALLFFYYFVLMLKALIFLCREEGY